RMRSFVPNIVSIDSKVKMIFESTTDIRATHSNRCLSWRPNTDTVSKEPPTFGAETDRDHERVRERVREPRRWPRAAHPPPHEPQRQAAGHPRCHPALSRVARLSAEHARDRRRRRPV